MGSVIVAIMVLSALVIVHELGHFAVAKLVGIKVKDFSLFMGPKIFGRRIGETEYCIRAIPLGGFVRMEGEEEESDDERAFNKKPVWARAAVIFTGPLMNIILAVLMFTFVPMIGAGFYQTTTISEVVEGSPAAKANLQPGDRIVGINERNIYLFNQVSFEVNMKNGEPVKIVVDRDGERVESIITPVKDVYDSGYSRYLIGVVSETKSDFIGFFRHGLKFSRWMTEVIFYGLKQLITGRADVNEISGPVGIISIISEQASTTTPSGDRIPIMQIILNLMEIAGLLSLNLGIFNLLPVPALDGSKLVILAVEKVRRKPIPPEREAIITMIGFALLIGLTLFATYNDIVKIMRDLF